MEWRLNHVGQMAQSVQDYSSLTIELLQLFLRLGTFQISDLFFNTIGGLAGGIIYFLVNAVAERIRRIRN